MLRNVKKPIIPKCSICKHPKIKEIDKALVLPNASIRSTALYFDLSIDSLGRHVRGGHIAKKITKAVAIQEAVDADDLLKEIQEIQQHQKEIFLEARNKKITTKDNQEKITPDNKLALEALRDQSKMIELKGKIYGSFREKQEQTGTIVIHFDKEDEGL